MSLGSSLSPMQLIWIKWDFFLSAPKTWHFIYVHSGFNAHSFFFVTTEFHSDPLCFPSDITCPFVSYSVSVIWKWNFTISHTLTEKQDKTVPAQKFPQKKGPLNSYMRTCNIIGPLKSWGFLLITWHPHISLSYAELTALDK